MNRKETENKVMALIYGAGMGAIWNLGGEWLVIGFITFLISFVALNAINRDEP